MPAQRRLPARDCLLLHHLHIQVTAHAVAAHHQRHLYYVFKNKNRPRWRRHPQWRCRTMIHIEVSELVGNARQCASSPQYIAERQREPTV